MKNITLESTMKTTTVYETQTIHLKVTVTCVDLRTLWQIIITKEIGIHQEKRDNITKSSRFWLALVSHYRLRGCSPGHVPERGLAPLFPKQRGVHQSVAEGGGDGGVLGQAAISRRLNNLRPHRSAEPALSHALQLGVGPRRQWPEGQGSRRRGCLKSFGMLMLCRVSTL